jgi:hypothetical protein
MDKSFNTKGKLLINDTEVVKCLLDGYVKNNPTDSNFIYKINNTPVFKDISLINKIIIGNIKINETHDTLSIEPWYETNKEAKYFEDKNQNKLGIDDEKSYKYVINWEKNMTKNGYPIIEIPFEYRQFALTSLPFRFNLKDKKFSADFLNANIAYLWIYGKTKFYKSKFKEPSSNYWGIGPYIGASTISDESEEKKADVFGFNYGINVIWSIQNINLSLALGAESGFTTKKNAFIPYWGIGIGIKLIEFYEPENKDD